MTAKEEQSRTILHQYRSAKAIIESLQTILQSDLPEPDVLRLREEIRVFRQTMERILLQINDISDLRLRTILLLRYCTGLTWKEIRYQLEPSFGLLTERHLHRLHCQALDAFLF